MTFIDKRIIGLCFSVAIGVFMLIGDVFYAWLTLVFSAFIGFFSVGLIISSIFLGRKALHWGLIGILPVVIFFGVGAIQRLVR